MIVFKRITGNYLALALVMCLPNVIWAQDDLMDMLEKTDTSEVIEEKTSATFKTTRLINAQTVETIKARTLIFNILHRFGNISGGGHSLFGFDNASNIRFAFNYALTDKWLIGIGRSKVNEHIDGSMKYKILGQTTNNRIPLSIAWFSNMAFTPKISPQNPDGSNRWTKAAHRLSYTHQLLIARKISSRISVEILPTLVHRNYVNSLTNAANGAKETNDLFALGIAGRVKVTKRLSLVADYFYTFSEFRESNDEFPYSAPLGIGIEIETGGHVFHLNFSNSSGVIENQFIPSTSDSWNDGNIKMGFNISRVFYL